MEDPQVVQLFTSPDRWAEAFLRDPDDKDKNFKLRSYQREVLQATRQHRNMILQWGRRMGKTVSMCSAVLWWATAYPLVQMIENKAKKQKPITIVLATPYESQIKEIWNTFMSLIGDSPLLKEQVRKVRTSDVHIIEFDNDSVIKGYTIGISSSNRGISMRGISCDILYMDEFDFIPRDIVEQVLMPIWTTNTKARLLVTSTPSGKRELFFDWCTRSKELGWFHTHYPSWHLNNTNWMSIEQSKEKGLPITESTEFQVKAITSQENYNREYGAEFGEEFGGVYKHTFINRCLVKYGRGIALEDNDIFDPGFSQNHKHKYIIGVDWNSYINGGQIVVVELCTTPTIVKYFDDNKNEDIVIDFTGKYRLFYRKGVKSKNATQRMTRLEIIRLLQTYKIDFVYVDYGAGDTNIEELTLYGREHPELEFSRKLRVIDSGAAVEHYDHIMRKMVKKRNKSLMVNFSALALEEALVVLPKEEDSPVRLVGQMRGYTIKNVTSRGEFSYEGEDHILDAFNLAMYGFQQNYGHLLNSAITHHMIALSDPRLADYPQRQQEFNGGVIAAGGSRAIRDPERELPFHKPVRINVPSFGKRATFGNRSPFSDRGRGNIFNGSFR